MMKTIPLTLLRHPVHLLSLGFGSGCAPKAPGTMGTLVGVLFYLPLQVLALPYYIAVVVFVSLAGIWLCGQTARALGVHDHPGIVWDEIAGYLLTMVAAPTGWGWIVLGFVLFRIFDIWKPWPIGFLDKSLKGGLGVMADDLVAGIFSLTIMQIIAYTL
jgi:phosphatidylglycerophosphatase A